MKTTGYLQGGSRINGIQSPPPSQSGGCQLCRVTEFKGSLVIVTRAFLGLKKESLIFIAVNVTLTLSTKKKKVREKEDQMSSLSMDVGGFA